MPERTIFRESAIEAYRRGTEKDIVPRLIARPIVVTFWLFLAALIAALLVAWSVKVPNYTAASGVVAGAAGRAHAAAGTSMAVLFVAPDQRARMRAGRPVHVQLGSSGAYVSGLIASVEPGLIGPDAARRRYRLRAGADVIAQPSVAVVVRLRKPLPRAVYGGSRLTAKIESGSQRLLALFPGLGGLA